MIFIKHIKIYYFSYFIKKVFKFIQFIVEFIVYKIKKKIFKKLIIFILLYILIYSIISIKFYNNHYKIIIKQQFIIKDHYIDENEKENNILKNIIKQLRIRIR
jgi:hypothetical protein